MPRKSHHVVHNSNGGWDVKKGGADRASGHFDTKIEAIKQGREISQNQRTEFLIHNMDGKISQSDSHGNDPNPPRGYVETKILSDVIADVALLVSLNVFLFFRLKCN